MNDLGSELRTLARRADAPTPADPADLWAAGRTRVRRHRLRAAAVAAVAVVLVGYGVVATPSPTVVMPAGEPHAPAIPKNVYSPNRFLAGVSDEGPPGQLAMIVCQNGEVAGPWFGIAAQTGEYRYLDLPDVADYTGMSLSPDGRRIAYWITGPTRKDDYGPADHGGNMGGPLPDRPAAGVAVYDAEDGSVTRFPVLTDFGIRPDDSVGASDLYWFDDDRLVFSYGVAAGTNMTAPGKSYLWQPGIAEPTQITTAGPWAEAYFPALPGPTHLRGESTRFEVVDNKAQPTGRTVVVPAGNGVPDAVSSWGDRVVKAGDNGGGGISRIFTGIDAHDGAAVRMRPVGDIVIPTFLGWRSATTVLVTALPAEVENGEVTGIRFSGTEETVRSLYSVDLVDGQVRRLGGVSSDLDESSLQVASSLLGERMVEGREPPSYLDVLVRPPFVYVTAGLALVLAFLAGRLLVRRRRRA